MTLPRFFRCGIFWWLPTYVQLHYRCIAVNVWNILWMLLETICGSKSCKAVIFCGHLSVVNNSTVVLCGYWSSFIHFLFFRKSPTFNKEVYVDFVAAQIKTLSFLAYIIRIYQDMVNTYSQNMVGGMLGLLRYCPQEVAHLRKELLIAARHILATDLRKSKQVL